MMWTQNGMVQQAMQPQKQESYGTLHVEKGSERCSRIEKCYWGSNIPVKPCTAMRAVSYEDVP